MAQSARKDRIQTLAQSYIDRGAYSGVEWLVHRGGTEWARGRVGMADALSGTEMPEKPIYRIYSMTKPLVSAAAMMLFERGMFRLYEPVAAYLPEFREMEVIEQDGTRRAAKRPILIENLLTHRSGLSYGFLENCPAGQLYKNTGILSGSISLQQMVEKIAELPLAFEPGTAWRYSVSTDVLARLLEVVTGEPLPKIIDDLIIAPLGLRDTGYVIRPEDRGRIMQMFGTHDLDAILNITGEPQTLKAADVSGDYPVDNPDFGRGGHGLYSTLDDYMAAARFLGSGLAPSGERLLSSKTIDMMWTNRVPENQRPLMIGPVAFPGYGYGLAGRVMVDMGQGMSLTSLGESGWAGAASTYFWIDRSEDLYGVVMSQYLGAVLPLADDIRMAVYQALDD